MSDSPEKPDEEAVEVIVPEFLPEGEVAAGVFLVQNLARLGIDKQVVDEILRKGMVIGYKAGYRRGWREGREMGAARMALVNAKQATFDAGWNAALAHEKRHRALDERTEEKERLSGAR